MQRTLKIAGKVRKKSMAKAVKGRNDLGHSSLYAKSTPLGRRSVLQKDREKFRSLLEGSDTVRYFDADRCRNIEHDCFDAGMDVGRVLAALDDFYAASRIVMREDEAFPERVDEYFTRRAQRKRVQRINRNLNKKGGSA